MDGVPTGDRQMFDDGAHGDGLTGDGTYGVEIGPFAIGTNVSYQIRATDTDGNAFLAPQNPNSFESLEPFVATSDILLVVDSTSSGNVSYIAPFYKDTLNRLGIAYDRWDASRRGCPDSGDLAQYAQGAVVYSVPYSSGFLIGSQTASICAGGLAAYLDAGGKLLISGQYLFNLSLFDRSFYENYLHSSTPNWCVGVWDINGTTGDIIGDGLSFRIQGRDGASNQGCPHVIVPRSPAEPVFNYVDLQGAAALPSPPPQYLTFDPILQPEQLEGKEAELQFSAPPQNPDLAPFLPEQELQPAVQVDTASSDVDILSHICSGTAALRVDTGVYKLVYFAFGFEAINSSEMRDEVMQHVLSCSSLVPSAAK